MQEDEENDYSLVLTVVEVNLDCTSFGSSGVDLREMKDKFIGTET